MEVDVIDRQDSSDGVTRETCIYIVDSSSQHAGKAPANQDIRTTQQTDVRGHKYLATQPSILMTRTRKNDGSIELAERRQHDRGATLERRPGEGPNHWYEHAFHATIIQSTKTRPSQLHYSLAHSSSRRRRHHLQRR